MTRRLAFVLLIAASAYARPKLVRIPNTAFVPPQSSNPTSFLQVGSQAIFIANDVAHGAEVWRTDGTPAGTSILLDAASGSPSSSPEIIGLMGDTALFAANENPGDYTAPASIWRTDGTAAGTTKFADLPSSAGGSSSFYTVYAAAGNRVFALVGNPSYPRTLWSTDGTIGGTRQIAIPLDPFGITTLLGLGNNVYFVGSDQTLGRQLWTSDGTYEGTHVVRRGVECPSDACAAPRSFFRMGDRLVVTTASGVWSTDGTPEGSVDLIHSASATLVASSPSVAYITTATDLWRTDGTPEGTQVAGPSLSAYSSFVAGDVLLFFQPTVPSSTASYDVWRNDGHGPVRLATLPFTPQPAVQFTPYLPVAMIGNHLLVPGNTPETNGELWSLDVGTGDSFLVKDIDARTGARGPYASSPGAGISLGGHILFAASSVSGRELWVTDGTADGTQQVANIASDPGGGSLSGIVRDMATNAPVANATVILCSNSGCSDYDATTTAGDGTYRFEAVNASTAYRVFVNAKTYVSQGYTGDNCGQCPLRAGTAYSGGTKVTVASGMETTAVDFSLVHGGTITGTVHRRSTGESLYLFSITIRDSSGIVKQTILGDGIHDSATSVALAPGNYTVQASANVASQVYNLHDCPASGCDYNSGDPVSVTVGGNATVDFQLPDGGQISGTILDGTTGGPAVAVTVRIHQGGSWYGDAITDAAGHYLSPFLAVGDYTVEVPNANINTASAVYQGLVYPNVPCSTNSFFCNTTGATPVTVTNGTLRTGIDMTLSRRSGSSHALLEGTILGRDGRPLTNLQVLIYNQSSNIYSPNFTITTDASGFYALYLVPGTYYLFAGGEAYPGVECAPSCDFSYGLPINLASQQVATLNMQLHSVQTTIQGHVLDATTGKPAFATVWAYDASGKSITSASTSSVDGHYTLSLLSHDDSLFIRAEAGNYRPLAYGAVPWPCTTTICTPPAGATAVPPGVTNGADFALQRFATISGTITDAVTSLPLPYALVRFESAADGSLITVSGDYYGNFTWMNADGSYYAAVSVGGYDTQIYDDMDCATTCDPTHGTLIAAIGSTSVTGINFHLRASTAGGTISGRVVDDSTGAGVAGVTVSAFNAAIAITDANGDYTLRSLVAGSYRITASAAKPYFYALQGGINCPTSDSCDVTRAVPVQVTAGQTVSGINFRLIRLHIASITPSSGPTSGGTQVVIAGANFTPDATVTIGEKTAALVSRTASQIVVTTPSAPAGPAHVTVNDGPFLSVTVAHGFTYSAAPFTIVARGSQASISVTATLPDGTTSATLYRRASISDPWTAIPGWTPATPIDGTNPPRGVLYQYHVEANAGGPLQISNVASAILFTDDPVIAGSTPVKSAHFSELLTAINAQRAIAGLQPVSLAAAAGTPVRAQDVNALRTALMQARSALGLAAPVFSDSFVSTGMTIKAAHIQELRELLR